MDDLRAIDLFSGCGGLTLGLKQAGFRVLGGVEVDALAATTFRLNHPEVSLWEQDIRALSVEAVKRKLGLRTGELELLAGCPPCQGFSSVRTLNRGEAVEDDRNDLVFEWLRFAEGLLPKTLMFENVPGLARDTRLQTLCARLGELGYTYAHWTLDAAQYGVPQRRRRLILLGSRFGAISPARRARKQLTVRSVIESLPRAGKSGDAIHDVAERRALRIRNLIAAVPPDGGSRRALPKWRRLSCHRRCDGFHDIYGRMAWDDVAPTITGGCVNPSKGRFLHPVENRSITLREAALLQSFPLRYKFSLDNGKFRTAELIGNALPPEFVRRHALQVQRHLKTLAH